MLIFVMRALLTRCCLRLTRIVREGRLHMRSSMVRVVHAMARMQRMLLAERIVMS